MTNTIIAAANITATNIPRSSGRRSIPSGGGLTTLTVAVHSFVTACSPSETLTDITWVPDLVGL
jgi:hypothetical protein